MQPVCCIHRRLLRHSNDNVYRQDDKETSFRFVLGTLLHHHFVLAQPTNASNLPHFPKIKSNRGNRFMANIHTGLLHHHVQLPTHNPPLHQVHSLVHCTKRPHSNPNQKQLRPTAGHDKITVARHHTLQTTPLLSAASSVATNSRGVARNVHLGLPPKICIFALNNSTPPSHDEHSSRKI